MTQQENEGALDRKTNRPKSHMKYHSAENDYRCKSLINSKTISVSKKITEIFFAGLINSKNNNVRKKLQTLQILQIFIECKIMVG